SHLVATGGLGPGFSSPAAPYTAVYVTEIVVLAATLVALLPLTRRMARQETVDSSRPFGLADIPA
ncbi:MAG: MFS transporter, partial [Gemmatimonas sp.]